MIEAQLDIVHKVAVLKNKKEKKKAALKNIADLLNDYEWHCRNCNRLLDGRLGF
jgi:rubrerythrin